MSFTEKKIPHYLYYLTVLLLCAFTLGAHALKHLSRPDVLLPLIVFLAVAFFMLCFAVIRVLRDKPARVKTITFGAGSVLIVLIAFATNWNPGGQLRKPGPWREWEIPAKHTEAYEAYRFAHAIKLPNEPKPDNFYKKGLFDVWGRTTSDEYFKHLCETEAGEFIYKKVEGVEGVFQMRPREKAISYKEMQDRYAMEDPYGYIRWEVRSPHTMFAHKNGFKYFETSQAPDWEKLERRGEKYLANAPLEHGHAYWRYWPNNTYEVSNAENINTLSSRYGFIWRGIRRPYDRENGIAGGELIVLDLETNEVLAVRRGFARTGRVKDNQTGINWEITQNCPDLKLRGGRNKDVDFTYSFIEKVLVPINKIKLASEEN